MQNAFKAGFEEGHYQGTIYDVLPTADKIAESFERWFKGYINKSIEGEIEIGKKDK